MMGCFFSFFKEKKQKISRILLTLHRGAWYNNLNWFFTDNHRNPSEQLFGNRKE